MHKTFKITVGDLRKLISEEVVSDPSPADISPELKRGDSRGDAIETIMAVLEALDAPTDYSLNREDDPPSHHRSIATMLVDKVRQYTDKSVYRVRFNITNNSIKAIADGRTIATLNLRDFADYVRGAVENATKEDPWGELVMDYDWSRRVT